MPVPCGQQQRTIPPPPLHTRRSPAHVAGPAPRAAATAAPAAPVLALALPPSLPLPPRAGSSAGPAPSPAAAESSAAPREQNVVEHRGRARHPRAPAREDSAPPRRRSSRRCTCRRAGLMTPIGSPRAPAPRLPEDVICVVPGWRPMSTVSGLSSKRLVTRYVPLGK